MSLLEESYRFCLVCLLGKSIVDLFPGAKLVGGKVSSHGFCYDFLYERSEMDNLTVKLVEDRMRLLLHEGIKFETVDMLRDNGAAYLVHSGQELRAEAVVEEFSPGLMEFTRVGELVEPGSCDLEMEGLSSRLKHFKLLGVESYVGRDSFVSGEQVWRISGTASSSQRELKVLLRGIENYNLSNSRAIAEEMRLCVENGDGRWLWLPRGVRLREALVGKWREIHEEQGVDIVDTGCADDRECEIFHKKIFESSDLLAPAAIGEFVVLDGSPGFGEAAGLWSVKKIFTDRTHLFVPMDSLVDHVISSLQFITKIVNMFCSESHWIVSSSSDEALKHHGRRLNRKAFLTEALDSLGCSYTVSTRAGSLEEPRAYLAVPDGLGKLWRGPFVGVGRPASSDVGVVSRSVFGSLERMVAFILEATGGNLPFWLAPDQVRLIVRGSAALEYCAEVRGCLQSAGFRVSVDPTEAPLGKRICAAEEERVPYIAVVGDEECRERTLSLRDKDGSKKGKKVALNEFLGMLTQQLVQGTGQK